MRKPNVEGEDHIPYLPCLYYNAMIYICRYGYLILVHLGLRNMAICMIWIILHCYFLWEYILCRDVNFTPLQVFGFKDSNTLHVLCTQEKLPIESVKGCVNSLNKLDFPVYTLYRWKCVAVSKYNIQDYLGPLNLL